MGKVRAEESISWLFYLAWSVEGFFGGMGCWHHKYLSYLLWLNHVYLPVASKTVLWCFTIGFDGSRILSESSIVSKDKGLHFLHAPNTWEVAPVPSGDAEWECGKAGMLHFGSHIPKLCWKPGSQHRTTHQPPAQRHKPFIFPQIIFFFQSTKSSGLSLARKRMLTVSHTET